MNIAFAGGGTAGHLYPALFTARVLAGRRSDFTPLFFVSRRGREREILEKESFHVEELEVSGFGAGDFPGALAAVFRLVRAYRRCRKILRRARVRAVVGFGAYVSAAPVLAMRALGGKVILHEQNAVMGRANRCLLPMAHAVAAGLPLSGESGGRDVVQTGIPARPGLIEAAHGGEARGFLGLRSKGFTVLVMGGSRGARSINRMMIAGAAILARAGGIQVVHLSGRDDYEEVCAGYAGSGVPASVFPYLREMEWAYGAADLVVSRSGAMTLSEIALAGLPAILIPYPHAASNHQEANARVFEGAGAAVIARQAALTPEALAERIIEMKNDPAGLRVRGEAARALARPRAAENLADLIERVVTRDP